MVLFVRYCKDFLCDIVNRKNLCRTVFLRLTLPDNATILKVPRRIAKNNPDVRRFYGYFYHRKKEDLFVHKFNIAIMPGDGIGKEITSPSFKLISQAASTVGIELNPIEVEAGAELYVRTGEAFPEENFQEAARADAI